MKKLFITILCSFIFIQNVFASPVIISPATPVSQYKNGVITNDWWNDKSDPRYWMTEHTSSRAWVNTVSQRLQNIYVLSDLDIIMKDAEINTWGENCITYCKAIQDAYQNNIYVAYNSDFKGIATFYVNYDGYVNKKTEVVNKGNNIIVIPITQSNHTVNKAECRWMEKNLIFEK